LLLSGRAIIDGVNLFVEPSRSLQRPPRPGALQNRQRPRELLLAPALAGLVALSLLVSACGGPSSPGVAAVGTTTAATTGSVSPTGSNDEIAALAFSRCMRAHGVPNFPDPDSQGSFPPLTQQTLGVSKQTSLAAQQACEHLLSSGGSIATPEQRQQKFAFGLEVARCIRGHGFPSFPDPSASSQGLPPGIDPSSPQFQAAETTCKTRAQKALGLR
jgi:hypothetical protein